jgi:diadenosine tetraphosphatase ApaH/serine/threonine PP2A family protein phosphatase
MLAIISDVHGNLEALRAVLDDIDRRRVSRVLCLGDLVGFGPDPVACVDIVRERCEVVLLGDFDQRLFADSEGFNHAAEMANTWTRRQLDSSDPDAAGRLRWLGQRPQTHREGRYLFVHGSPRYPLDDFLFPEDLYNPRKMEREFNLIDHVCFCGHTHIPGVFYDQVTDLDEKTSTLIPAVGEPAWHFAAPAGAHTFPITDHKCIINVGSVGQPRDADWRACYVLFNGDRVMYRRVEYDVEATIRKIHAIPEIDNFLGDRLREGH